MANGTSRLRVRVHGLDCAEEVAALRKEVGPAVGGEDHLAFDILEGTMTVESSLHAGAEWPTSASATGAR